jgi:CHAD domain-containing protein
MVLSLAPSHFVTKMEENIKRLDDRLNDYIKDSNENNIHDIRTATRRLDASFTSLPKKIRRKTKIRKYVTTSKQLFKVNSQVRDYDIIFEKLQKHSSEPIYPKLTGSLNRKRETKLHVARKIALSLRDFPIPRVSENEISAKQLDMRFNKVVLGLRQRIEQDLPVVITNPNKIEELHELRKSCKKMRYLLEQASHQNNIDNKEIHSLITELEDVQDILGSIHDSDTVIAYLRRVRHPDKVPNILNDEISERNKKYEDFIQFYKGSDTRYNFIRQITLLT